MSAKKKTCSHPTTVAGMPPFQCVFAKRGSFSQKKYGTTSKIQAELQLLKIDKGWKYLNPKVIHYDDQQQ